MRWVDSYNWIDSCKWVDAYTMKCGGRPSLGAWYLQIPAQGLGLALGQGRPARPAFQASVQNPRISAHGAYQYARSRYFLVNVLKE